MKSLFKGIILSLILTVSLTSKQTHAAIGLASTGPAAAIFIVTGGVGGGFGLMNLENRFGYTEPIAAALLLGGIILLDNPEEQIVESLKTQYPFLDQSTAMQTAILLSEKIENQHAEDENIILNIEREEITHLLNSTDLLDSEKALIINDFVNN